MGKRKHGFTLVEMAIILVIIGLIVATILPAVVRSIKREKLSEGRRTLRTVRDEIVGFAIINRRLPSSLSEIGHDTDPWQQDLYYRPAQGLDSNSTDICDTNSTTLSVTQTGSTFSDIAFVVASKGENYNLQLNDSTTNVTVYQPGQTVDSYSAGGDPNRSEEYDDIVEYVTLGYLKTKACTSSGSNGNGGTLNGADITFAQHMPDFPQSGAVTRGGDLSVIVDQNAKTISLGNDIGSTYGCIWYQGSESNCTSGVCQFGDGLRAYFKFRFSSIDTRINSTEYADGFTFAMINSTDNTSGACGGFGEYLGYSWTRGGATGIDPPKLAVEVDVYRNNARGDHNNSNHVAYVYWGRAAVDNDDNTHGAGGIGQDPENPEYPSSGYYEQAFSGTAWLEDNLEHTFRIELDRNATTRVYDMSVWIDCSSCDDLSTDFNGTATITDTITLGNSDNTTMNSIRFGWTMATGGRTQTVTISDFGINFLP